MLSKPKGKYFIWFDREMYSRQGELTEWAGKINIHFTTWEIVFGHVIVTIEKVVDLLIILYYYKDVIIDAGLTTDEPFYSM